MLDTLLHVKLGLWTVTENLSVCLSSLLNISLVLDRQNLTLRIYHECHRVLTKGYKTDASRNKNVILIYDALPI